MRFDPGLIVGREAMREYDRLAIAELGVPGLVLMENAGRGAARIARDLCAAPGPVLVLAGPGNNGGDGYVLARHLLGDGYAVEVVLTAAREHIRGDAATNLAVLERLGLVPAVLGETMSLEGLVARLAAAGLVVDALLGTGLTRPVHDPVATVIDLVNAAGRPVLALDLPSGIAADTGQILGAAIRARATATFGHLKMGLVQHPGRALAGETTVVPLALTGVPSARVPIAGRLLDAATVAALVPWRDADAHKGTAGHLLVIAGTPGKSGAAVLAGLAAVRAGAGLVTVATDTAAHAAVEARSLEAMIEPLGFHGDALDDARLDRLVAGRTAVIAGPGIGTSPGAAALIQRLLTAVAGPLALDADGLNLLAAHPGWSRANGGPLVLTPHPGEAARLAGVAPAVIQADRPRFARELAARHQAVVVLKGAGTVIAAPDGRLAVNPTGNPALGTGGTGDVLAGIIGALLAQGLEPFDAACLATWVHGLAADRLVARRGGVGLAARDLLDELPASFQALSAAGRPPLPIRQRPPASR